MSKRFAILAVVASLLAQCRIASRAPSESVWIETHDGGLPVIVASRSASRDSFLDALKEVRHSGAERVGLRCWGTPDASVVRTAAISQSYLECRGIGECDLLSLGLLVSRSGIEVGASKALGALGGERALLIPMLPTGSLDWMRLRKTLTEIRAVTVHGDHRA